MLVQFKSIPFCYGDVICVFDEGEDRFSCENSGSRDRESVTGSSGNRSRTPPKMENKLKKVPYDIPTTSHSGILGVGGSPPPVPPMTVVAAPEITDRTTVTVTVTVLFRNT